MKRMLLVIGLATMTASITGCVVSIGSGTHTRSSPPPPVVVTDSPEAATIAEIDAASKLNLDSSRLQALTQIAERPSLGQAAQVHLVNVAFRNLNFDSSKVLLLSKVITRQDFGDATRHAIVSQLDQLSFESSKQTVLGQINERMVR